MMFREIPKKIRPVQIRASLMALAAITGLLLLCSCTTAKKQLSGGAVAASELPSDVTMNKDAGRGEWLFVTLHLEDGEELPFFLDTGAAATYLDASLAPKLGIPLKPENTSNGGQRRAPAYPAPKLFLGNKQLNLGDTVQLIDLTKESAESGRRVMGVLGISCLKHYCIQLDFTAGKIRFLDPTHLETASLGKPFPIDFWGPWHQPVLPTGGLVEGTRKPTLIDSGASAADGTLTHEQFAAAIHQRALMPVQGSTQQGRLSKSFWGGETNNDLTIERADWNAIGLKFMARHLVTLDFPGKTMYLKQTSPWPLLDGKVQAALDYLWGLRENGQLPGWSKNEKGTVHLAAHLVGPTFEFIGQKSGDSSNYHYIVMHLSEDGPWQLRKAWRADQAGKKIEEYPAS